jgi:predicted methyltransferase
MSASRSLQLLTLAALLGALTACDKPTENPEPTPTPAPAEPAEPAAPAEDPEAKKQREAEERLAKRIADAEAAAAKEVERWTPELREAVTKLASAKYKKVDDQIAAILASAHRTPGNADRDADRHPAEMLKFIGIKANWTVIELGTGAGWWTELLAPLVAKSGKLIVPVSNPEGPRAEFSTFYGIRQKLMLDKAEELYGKVERIVQTDASKMDLGAAGRADLVIAFREMHNWVGNGAVEARLAAAHAALKPGGLFVVEQHRGKEGDDPKTTAEKGYLPEAWVIEQVTAAGFELVERSEINANPKDTKDHPEGVWTLPPSLALGEKDREKYVAIGESDRMTLKFRKPKGKGK